MKALLVVDVQVGLMAKKIYNKGKLISIINHTIGERRKSKDLIVFVQHNSLSLEKGTKEWELDSSLNIAEDDPIIQKSRGNAFEKTGLKKMLDDKGIKDIEVCGLVSFACVKATCLGGIKEKLSVALLRDGHSCWSADARAKIEAVEKSLAESGVEIIEG